LQFWNHGAISRAMVKRVHIKSYFDQFIDACKAAGIQPADVCRAEGVGYNTLWRWRTGKCRPRQDTIERLFAGLEKMRHKTATGDKAA